MEGKLAFTRMGCNRVVGCLDWSEKGWVAFGAHHFVAVYDTERACIVGTLNGHKAQVNCVKWMRFGKNAPPLDEYLVSGSADRSVRIWKWNGQVGEHLATLQESQSGITAIAVHAPSCNALPSSQPSVRIAVCSSDAAVKLWHSVAPFRTRDWRLSSTISTATLIHHSVALVSLPNQPDRLLLALGGTDCVIRLYAASGNSEFQQVCKLSGHEDWIRGLDFYTHMSDSKLLLASAAQDRYVRVWSMATTNKPSKLNPLAQFAPSLSFLADEKRYTVKLEGLLIGHEDWVHSVQFNPVVDRIQLLSASMDRTMILWEFNSEHQCWEQTVSVGDAGCSPLGYFTGVFGPNGQSILAHGFTGALHLWSQDDQDAWLPKPAMTGHCGCVIDMCLAVSQQPDSSEPFTWIMTVSKDQTTRIAGMLDGNWREIARPQVHGHDFYAVTSIPNKHPECFVSCSEEKVIRVFSAPTSFHQYLHANKLTAASAALPESKSVPYGASIKALALTNTAVYEEELGDQKREIKSEGVVDNYSPGPDFAPYANPTCAVGAPLEEHLSQNTLWPEIQKLYGHGDVVYSLAASPCGQFLASACKAQREEVAVIFIWDTTTWTPLQQLKGHTLTVTRMEFSPTGQYLLSGSRDRTFCLFQKQEGCYSFMLRKLKAHGRVIWDVCWTPDAQHFATASRDQSIKIWSLPEAQCIRQLSFDDGVTALSFQPRDMTACPYVLAVGLQNGEISLWTMRLDEGSCSCELTWKTDMHDCHADAVHRLRWTTLLPQSCSESRMFLASCSADHSVRLFALKQGIEQIPTNN